MQQESAYPPDIRYPVDTSSFGALDNQPSANTSPPIGANVQESFPNSQKRSPEPPPRVHSPIYSSRVLGGNPQEAKSTSQDIKALYFA